MRFLCLGKQDFLFLGSVFVLCALIINQGISGTQAVLLKSGEKKLPVYCVNTDEKKIAVTFDAAWGNSDTDTLLGVLDKHKAKATFFFTGEFVSRYPDDVLKIYAAGHSCQNHSDSHSHIDKLTPEELLADTKRCSDKIYTLTGVLPTLYRGPYGEYNNELLTAVENLKMTAIQWDTDSRDWQKKSVDYMVKSVTENAKNGSILLFHNDTQNTPEALDKILEILSEKGFSFVTADSLIYKQNYYIDSAGMQHKN